MHQVQQTGQLAVQHVSQSLSHRLAPRYAENIINVLLIDRVSAERNKLVQHGLSITHTAVCHSRDSKGSLLTEGHSLFGSDIHQMVRDDGARNGAKIKALAAGKDRRQNFVRLRCRKNKHHMRRRLLQRLEQSVEGLLREHVHLINVNDTVVAARRRKLHIVPQVTNVINTAIGGAVNLEHIQTAPLGNLPAHVLIRVKIHLRPAGAVKSLGKNTRRGGLAGAARPDE